MPSGAALGGWCSNAESMSGSQTTSEPPWRRRYSSSRSGLFFFLVTTVAAGVFVAGFKANDVVLYNHSPSIPVGLYVRTNATATRDAVVTVRAADVAHDYAHARGFVDDGDRFIKRVVGAEGDTVCAARGVVTINGTVAARRHERDSAGRMLPIWSGCRTLSANEVFLLGDTEYSFDSRYWGVVRTSKIEGVWRPFALTSTPG